MDLPITDYQTAVKGLRQLKAQPGLGMVFETLQLLQVDTAAVRIMAELDQAAFQNLCDRWRPDDKETDLIFECFTVIDKFAPTDDFAYERVFGGERILLPAAMGYPVSWDEWDEMSHDLEDNREYLFYKFFNALRLHDGETFNNLSERWDLGVKAPDFSQIDGIDWPRFCRILKRQGLEPFIDAINVCWYDTGNIYFDFNPYDEYDYDPSPLPEFSLAGVRQLMDQYQQAQPIQANLRKALEMVEADPGLYGRLFKIYNRCLHRVERERARVPTLGEIFHQACEEEYTDFAEGF